MLACGFSLYYIGLAYLNIINYTYIDKENIFVVQLAVFSPLRVQWVGLDVGRNTHGHRRLDLAKWTLVQLGVDTIATDNG